MGSFGWRQIWMGKQDCRGNGGGLFVPRCKEEGMIDCGGRCEKETKR